MSSSIEALGMSFYSSSNPALSEEKQQECIDGKQSEF
jgi:dihydroxy-acid dehydratase